MRERKKWIDRQIDICVCVHIQGEREPTQNMYEYSNLTLQGKQKVLTIFLTFAEVTLLSQKRQQFQRHLLKNFQKIVQRQPRRFHFFQKNFWSPLICSTNNDKDLQFILTETDYKPRIKLERIIILYNIHWFHNQSVSKYKKLN